MERHRKMDVAGPSRKRRTLIAFLFFPLYLAAQTSPSNAQFVERVQQLLNEQRWQELVEILQPVQPRSADLDFYYGTALAKLGRWQEAHDAFESGAWLKPQDKQFPLELAGVEFKQKHYRQSAHYVRRALRLDPHDSYGNDFLGTVYFLEGNLEAALKYWNRVDKPRVAEVHADPVPHLDPVLLDRAIAFAPASTLRLPELLLTHSRVHGLGIFPIYSVDLLAREDGAFDVVFRNWERNGWGHNYKEGLFLLLRGLPFQTINPELYNLKHEAINFVSLFRWDAEKRRVTAQLSSPFKHNPKFNYQLFTDLRSENWNIQTSFQGPTTLLGSLNLRLFCQCALALVSRSGNFPSRFSQRHPGNGPNANSSGQRLSTEAGSASGGLTLARSGASHEPGRRRALRSGAHLVAALALVRKTPRLGTVSLVSPS